MSLLYNKKWKSGAGQILSIKEVNNKISKHLSANDKLFIGSDSFISQKKVCFVTAVCLLTNNFGGKYFFYKEKIPSHTYKNLTNRITEEARRSIELAEFFTEKFHLEPNQIELHLDVSPSSAKEGTSKISDMLKGYVQGYGFQCKLKPHAWASQSVADRHSK